MLQTSVTSPLRLTVEGVSTAAGHVKGGIGIQSITGRSMNRGLINEESVFDVKAGHSNCPEGIEDRNKMSSEEAVQTSYSKARSDSPKKFTAVNGSESAAPTREERSNGQPRINPPGQEKLTITTTTTGRKQEWAQPRPISPPERFGDHRNYSRAHKRKRSGSLDHDSTANPYHSHAMPPSMKQTPTTGLTDTDAPREDALRGSSLIHPREAYNADMHYRQFYSANDEREPASANDMWSAQQYSSVSQMTPSDDHLREALVQGMEPQSAYERDQGTPNSDDRSAHPFSTTGYERREVSVQSDPKKRKRNFSNRTKTGCMTCRRRKKKCDETMPECKCSISIRKLTKLFR